MAKVTASEARERLHDALGALEDDIAWKRFLRMRSSFHDYSVSNLALILAQRPDATVCAGYKAWQEKGRQVRKGERGIDIFAPMLKKDDDGEKRLIGFRIVKVFDIAQTDGEDLPTMPEVFEPTGDDDRGLGARLHAVADAEGVSVTVDETPEGVGGFYRPADRSITLAEADPVRTARTLCHELAHHFDREHWADDPSRADAEVVAESAAFIVTTTAGLDAGDYSFGYVHSWADGDVAKVRELMDRVDTVTAALLDGIAA